MKKPDLGSYLKLGRMKSGYSPAEVAKCLGLKEENVVQWERGIGAALPLSALKALIPLYRLDEDVVFELLLQHQLTRIAEKCDRLARRKV